eukprot:TRINITY_DN8911_c0_g1_i1.p1 TRINITY_DN8911_c0_g1~~TRINITY_DN8911_c0_g1_i1.p1  ORF type:complete len:292 (+),score=76.02 TRINITY_DN8911_c0_g1_i1:76-951(+)
MSYISSLFQPPSPPPPPGAATSIPNSKSSPSPRSLPSSIFANSTTPASSLLRTSSDSHFNSRPLNSSTSSIFTNTPMSSSPPSSSAFFSAAHSSVAALSSLTIPDHHKNELRAPKTDNHHTSPPASSDGKKTFTVALNPNTMTFATVEINSNTHDLILPLTAYPFTNNSKPNGSAMKKKLKPRNGKKVNFSGGQTYEHYLKRFEATKESSGDLPPQLSSFLNDLMARFEEVENENYKLKHHNSILEATVKDHQPLLAHLQEEKVKTLRFEQEISVKSYQIDRTKAIKTKLK